MSTPTTTNPEIVEVLRLLAVQPWLLAGRDDPQIAMFRRHRETIERIVRQLGWQIVADRETVRMTKSIPNRLHDWLDHAPPTAEACSWVFLFAAALEGLPRKVTLADVVAAGMSVAAEADIAALEGFGLRKKHAGALRELVKRGVIDESEGTVDTYLYDSDAQVLLTVNHTRLAYLVTNWTTTVDPIQDPQGWLDALGAEGDIYKRMRSRLVDDTVVHKADLDDDEDQWLQLRLNEVGGSVADSFGLTIERRKEGVSLVVPDETFSKDSELGDVWFPKEGAAGHAALLLCDHIAFEGETAGGPGTGWMGMSALDVNTELERLVSLTGNWPTYARDDTSRLLGEACDLLMRMGLLRVIDGIWWVSPATGRYEAPPNQTAAPAPKASVEPLTLTFFDLETATND